MKYVLKIKEYRLNRNMTQKELATRIGVHQTYVSKLENNSIVKRKPTLDLIIKICDVLDVCPHSIVSYTYDCKNNCTFNCDKNF